MLDCNKGKLLVYASSFSSAKNRLESVNSAAERLAKLLKAKVEVKRFRKRFASVYVYYANGVDEPIPIYCSNGEASNTQEIYAALRNMLFVLSFHPKHAILKQMREEVMRFS